MMAVMGSRIDRLDRWFQATLQLLTGSGGGCLAAYDDVRVMGVLLHSPSRPPSTHKQLVWAASVMMRAGPGPVLRTAAHDRARRDVNPQGARIVEFVAVHPDVRGRGIAKSLFAELHRSFHNTWLETTRIENVTIFERLGYRQRGSRSEDGVEYFHMERS
jgi:ribosomal protein S18 acetylase RimI-like enzyme